MENKIFGSINRRKFLKSSVAAVGGLSALRLKRLSASERFPKSQDPSEDLVAKLVKIPSRHPSLHFDVGGLEQLRSRVKGTHRRYAEMLYEWVDRNRTWSPPGIYELYSAGAEVPLEQSGAFVTNTALAFVLSRRDEYLQLSRRWAMAMCEYPTKEVRNYGAGIYAAGLARVYDWLYQYLTSEERERIRTNLVKLVGQLYRGSIPESSNELWWARAQMHHDHWIPVGGYGEAALALVGEVDEASRWAARAKSSFDYALSWFGDDGAWHEGAADWVYTMAPLLWFYNAWQNVVGENLHNAQWIRNTAKYRLYHWLPDDSYVYLNDSFRSGRYNTSGSASSHILRRLASLFQDGYAQWLAERDEAFDMKPAPKGVYQAPYERLSYRGEPKEYLHTDSQCVAWNVLWYDPTVKPVPPKNLPRMRHFKNQGVVIMRTGWDNDAAVVSFACAPLPGHHCAERRRAGEDVSRSNYSHAHADYSSFTLFACGEYFIIPPGYARRGSGFQNVVSVNGADFLVDPSIDVRIVASREEKDFSYAVGDAAEAFPSQLEVQQYRRHLLLLEYGQLVIFDNLRLTEIGRSRRHYNRFVWTVHSDPTAHTLSISGTKASWKPQSNSEPILSMYLLEPQDFAWENALLQSTGSKNMLEVLRLIKSEWYSGGMQVLTVWSWQKSPETPTLLRHSDFLAVVWEKAPDKPAVGFSISTGIPSDLSHPDLKNRKLLLFGYDPDNPDSFVSIKNGKVQ